MISQLKYFMNNVAVYVEYSLFIYIDTYIVNQNYAKNVKILTL